MLTPFLQAGLLCEKCARSCQHVSQTRVSQYAAPQPASESVKHNNAKNITTQWCACQKVPERVNACEQAYRNRFLDAPEALKRLPKPRITWLPKTKCVQNDSNVSKSYYVSTRCVRSVSELSENTLKQGRAPSSSDGVSRGVKDCQTVSKHINTCQEMCREV